MNLSELLKNGLVEKFESSKDQIKDEIEVADKNLASAQNMYKMNELDWASVVAYTAMQHAGTALMFFKGYRPKGRDHHVAVVDFVGAVFPSKIPADVCKAFEKGRKDRHELIYDKLGTVTAQQVERMVSKAEILVTKAKEIVGC